MNTTDQHTGRESIAKEYSRLAPAYDRRWSFYIEATARETIARLSRPLAGRVLDVGCGTGVLLQRLARQFPQVTLVGIDPVPEMLAVARGRVPPGTSLHAGWAEELPFATDAFDIVVSCSMLHYVRQPAAALREMSRVLRPGGALVLTDWCGDYLVCRGYDWWLRLVSPAHVRMYRERELRRVLAEAGYPKAHIERYKINWFWGLMTARVTKPRGPRPFIQEVTRMAPDSDLRALVNLPYEQAVQKSTDALKAEGFGVLTQIDVQATLKEKINVDFRRYMILGACNPALAHRALSANLDVGLLLPCNVTVYEEGDASVVTAVDPVDMLGDFTEDPVAHEVAVEARTRLLRVIASLK